MFNCPLLSQLCIHCQDCGSKMYWENMNTSNRLPKYRHQSLCAGHPIRCTLDRNHEPSSWRSHIHRNRELHSSFPPQSIEVASVIELSEASGRVAVSLFIIHPPTIDTLVTGRVGLASKPRFLSQGWASQFR